MKRIGTMIGKRRYGAGQSATEFALVATVFLLTMFGIFMMGSMVFDYNSISSAAREAARFALVHGSTSASASAIQTVAINAAPSLGLTTDEVVVTFPTALKVPSLLHSKIVIIYPYTIEVPILSSQSL